MPVYVIILALALLCRAGGLAHATWSDRQDARDEAASQAGRSVGLTADRSLWSTAYQRADQQDARNAGYAACRCATGPGGLRGGGV